MKAQQLKFILFLFFAISLSGTSQLNADTIAGNKCYNINGHYIGSYFTDSWEIIKSPLRWEGNDWLKAGIFAGSWFALHTQDKNIQQWSQDNRTSFTDFSSEYVFDPLGYGFYTMPVYAGLYVYGALGKHHQVSDFALQGAKVFLVSAAFARVIKQVSHRHRPYQDNPPNPHNWDGPFSKFTYDAFPSGHTISAFATAAFLTNYFDEEKWVGWVAYPVAAAVGYSRINDNKHWATDVLAGAVLGHYIGKFLTRGKCRDESNVMVVANNSGGISIIYNIR